MAVIENLIKGNDGNIREAEDAGAKRFLAVPRRMSRINTIVYRVTVFRVYGNCI